MLIAFIAIAIVAVGVTGFIGFTIAKNALQAESLNKLTAVREMKANQIEDYFQQISGQVVTLSEDRMIVEATKAFDDSYREIDSELDRSQEEVGEAANKLRGYYSEEYLSRLIPNLQSSVSVDEFWPEETTTQLLQDLYIASNPFEVGSKHLLDNPGDGSRYSDSHELYHPIIRNFLDTFGYYDIFLANTEGDIVYTVFKEVDYGTSLLDGPYSDTNFAEAFRSALDAGKGEFVYMVDFDPYAPSYNAPAAFIASPIFDDGEKIGVLLFQMPVDRINDIMTNRQAWNQMGLGDSGETYLVGDDLTIRNQSRFLIEDSDEYFDLLQETGTEQETIDQIRNLNSSIGLQEVMTDGTRAAQAGETGTAIFPDYRGIPVLSSYKPLEIPGVNWVIMSEIDEAEAFAPAQTLGRTLLISSIILLILIVILAIIFSRSITGPLETLAGNASELADGNLDITINTDRKDEIGDLSRSFDSMRQSVKQFIRQQNAAIDALSTPMIPLTDDIVVMPLVGELDERRLGNASELLTEGLYTSSARVAILDLTGVPSLDEAVAMSLIRVAKKANLLGAKVVITGLQPQVAVELTELNLHLEGISTERTLQNGVNFAMNHLQTR
ncbi:MAG: HAMP domain-containing protein [Chloroflexi bacterium]|jgi:methyl-accepting chemotaxis protein|nr:HAMP domain-containing protein [Chloroflexota bacterium]